MEVLNKIFMKETINNLEKEKILHAFEEVINETSNIITKSLIKGFL